MSNSADWWRSISLFNEMVQVPATSCPTLPCYYGIGVTAFGRSTASYLVVVFNASEPVYLVRALLTEPLPIVTTSARGRPVSRCAFGASTLVSGCGILFPPCFSS